MDVTLAIQYHIEDFIDASLVELSSNGINDEELNSGLVEIRDRSSENREDFGLEIDQNVLENVERVFGNIRRITQYI